MGREERWRGPALPRYNHGSRSGSALLLLSAREKWFPQTNFWEKRGGRLGASRRCLVIIIVLTFARMPPTNYDDRFERFSHTKRDTIRETSVLPRLEMYFRNGTIDYRNRSVLSLSIYIYKEREIVTDIQIISPACIFFFPFLSSFSWKGREENDKSRRPS